MLATTDARLEAFALKIPDNLASQHAARTICAGLTPFSPLVYFGNRHN